MCPGRAQTDLRGSTVTAGGTLARLPLRRPTPRGLRWLSKPAWPSIVIITTTSHHVHGRPRPFPAVLGSPPGFYRTEAPRAAHILSWLRTCRPGPPAHPMVPWLGKTHGRHRSLCMYVVKSGRLRDRSAALSGMDDCPEQPCQKNRHRVDSYHRPFPYAVGKGEKCETPRVGFARTGSSQGQERETRQQHVYPSYRGTCGEPQEGGRGGKRLASKTPWPSCTGPSSGPSCCVRFPVLFSGPPVPSQYGGQVFMLVGRTGPKLPLPGCTRGSLSPFDPCSC
jgi:hypothetical protein